MIKFDNCVILLIKVSQVHIKLFSMSQLVDLITWLAELTFSHNFFGKENNDEYLT